MIATRRVLLALLPRALVALAFNATIAAIVSLAGANSSVERGPPVGPVHVLLIRGTADETVLFEGGQIQAWLLAHPRR